MTTPHITGEKLIFIDTILVFEAIYYLESRA